MKKIVIVPTHSDYMDICAIFIKLFNKNVNYNFDYEIILSITGKNVTLQGVKCLYNGENASLPSCIYNVVKKYSHEYYICCLGDAFFYKKIKDNFFDSLINSMKEKNFNYCSLTSVVTKKKKKNACSYFRYINTKDRYAYSFIAFVASKRFIINEFESGISDLDFEIKYNLRTKDKKNMGYVDDSIIIKKDIDLLPGIEKGKWNRKAYRLIKKYNPEIDITGRELVSRFQMMYLFFARQVFSRMPNFIRLNIKSLVKSSFKVDETG